MVPYDVLSLRAHQGAKPVMFVSKHGSQAVRMVLPPAPRAKASDGKGKGKKEEREREGKDGLKCYVQQKKAIIGIAPHPARALIADTRPHRHTLTVNDTVIVALADGSVSACQFVPKQTYLTTLWTINGV